ncbi:MAG TPA: type II toxin-antitoxin system RelB/DinJ family antitoxin [Candidatus Onthocola stercorigallinarum]|nr:type II toxin-antitoxin system RelB/DinJ family antitoxin [Candidatus Onthocola stercorigallinarum]
MANLTSAINIQVDSKTKKEASAILSDLGLSMSTAINLFLRQVIKRDGLPFEVTNPKPSKDLLKALREAENIINQPENHKGYNNIDELKKALLTDD